uniref:Uncharacterized protein LOC105048773 n=1 Tax=Elaeis guineensis var. tenera TaxID=51953 RepID=A0A8N4IEV0_ELAGV
PHTPFSSANSTLPQPSPPLESIHSPIRSPCRRSTAPGPTTPPAPGRRIAGHWPAADTLPEQRPGGNLSSSITLLGIQQDRPTKIAAANWLKTAGLDTSAWKFDRELVKEIYETEILVFVARRTVPLQRSLFWRMDVFKAFLGRVLRLKEQAQMMSHYAVFQKSVSHPNGPPASSSENHVEETDMPLTNGETENKSLENGAACASGMEE